MNEVDKCSGVNVEEEENIQDKTSFVTVNKPARTEGFKKKNNTMYVTQYNAFIS